MKYMGSNDIRPPPPKGNLMTNRKKYTIGNFALDVLLRHPGRYEFQVEKKLFRQTLYVKSYRRFH